MRGLLYPNGRSGKVPAAHDAPRSLAADSAGLPEATGAGCRDARVLHGWPTLATWPTGHACKPQSLAGFGQSPAERRNLGCLKRIRAGWASWAAFCVPAESGLSTEKSHGVGGGESINPDDHAGFSAQGMPCKALRSRQERDFDDSKTYKTDRKTCRCPAAGHPPSGGRMAASNAKSSHARADRGLWHRHAFAGICAAGGPIGNGAGGWCCESGGRRFSGSQHQRTGPILLRHQCC